MQENEDRQSGRIGVYVCHCGANIAGSVDCAAVSEYASTLLDVVVSRHEGYSCSQAGQDSIKEDINEFGLDRVVVASCSPRLHEPTFRQCISEAGLNPYLLEMANLREQCSWVHSNDKEAATKKAKDLVKSAVARSRCLGMREESEVPVEKATLVIGGGVAGIQSALDLADSGYKVVLVEKKASIGGIMAGLDKTFPTLDCSI
jgi:heterodisulfide reductase subunit A2